MQVDMILVALDNSDNSFGVCEYVVKNLVRPGSHIAILHVITSSEIPVSIDLGYRNINLPEYNKKVRKEVELSKLRLKEYEKIFKKNNVKFTSYLNSTKIRPNHIILSLAKEIAATYIVFGSTQTSRFLKNIKGSESSKVSSKSTIPVIIVK